MNNLTCTKCGAVEGWMFTSKPIYTIAPETRWYWKWLGPTKLIRIFEKVVCESCLVEAV